MTLDNKGIFMNWILRYLDESNNTIVEKQFESFKDAIDDIQIYEMSQNDYKYVKVVLFNRIGIIHFEATFKF